LQYDQHRHRCANGGQFTQSCPDRRIAEELEVELHNVGFGDPRSDSARMITEFSNNQNSVKARDFKANNQIQIRLQNDVTQHYGGDYAFEIKRGETLGAGTVISNEVLPDSI
jgi:AIPR protein